MTSRIMPLLLAAILLIALTATAQITPWFYWTLLPQDQRDEIVGEASGETAWNTIMDTGGYNKNRQAEEYEGNLYEVQNIYDRLKLYGLPGTEIVRFPGTQVWDGVKGELWETAPMRQKLASYTDMTAMLVNGSNSADVEAELVWVGLGTNAEIERVDVAGKIVVTEGSVGSVHDAACRDRGALGVVAISASRPYFDPLQIPWSRLGGRGGGDEGSVKFGFYLPVREGDYLKQRLLNGEKITVHAEVETTMEPYELQDVVARIPGTDRDAGEIILSAHLFEGIVKQGANDNKSGSAGILETARVLHTLIEEGRLPRPKRTIRFLWGPEFSGTGPWVQSNRDIMERTLCNINMDMVGEWLSKNKAFMCLMRTSYGNPHYINDVMENFYRFVGEGNRERIQNRRNFFKIPHRIVAPSGADEPFYYSIETHYGASDHEVFNDWGVQVPAVMMIAWPDQWYHTSGDRIDKADPTQLKRVAVIAAGAAFTVANADDDGAIRIAGEVTSNATRRLGHQFIVAQETLNLATTSDFNDAYKMARIYMDTAIDNEKDTLQTVLELAEDRQRVGAYVGRMAETIDQIGAAHLAALETHMQEVAKRLRTAPAEVRWTDLEKKASQLVPKPTAKVKANGYRGYLALIDQVPESEREKYPYDNIASTGELQLLIDGERSVLDIKNALDAQYPDRSELESVLNYIEILELAGLVETEN